MEYCDLYKTIISLYCDFMNYWSPCFLLGLDVLLLSFLKNIYNYKFPQSKANLTKELIKVEG
jgi:hypothetical protein